MRRDLAAEIRAFLEANGPSTAPEIGRGIRARRSRVDAALAGGGFSHTAPPEWAGHRAIYWDASERVPRAENGKSRAALLLDVLADGGWHSRADIFRTAGHSFLTNNAAAELRRAGHDVLFERGGYRLVADSASGACPPSTGAASEPIADRVAA